MMTAIALGMLGLAPAAARAARPVDMGADQKIEALVIGVSYATAPQQFHLTNSLLDARAFARFVNERANHHATLVEDPNVGAIDAALHDYLARVDKKTIALLYYSGHGVQVGGTNYIVPRDADALIPIAEVVESIRGKARMIILIMDACRNNPFAATAESGRSLKVAPVLASASRSIPSIPLSAAQVGGTRGLAEFRLRGRGIKVVFSTDPGNVALDGDPKARNSPFTAALLQSLGERKSFDEVLADVTRAVAAKTAGEQVPWVQGSLEETVFFAGKPARFDQRNIVMPPP